MKVITKWLPVMASVGNRRRRVRGFAEDDVHAHGQRSEDVLL